MCADDGFEREYTAGVLEEDPPAAGEGPGGADAAARAFALRGCVVTRDRVLPRGYVVVEGGMVADVRTRRPQGVDVLDTDGVILPGLVDLHGHPEYNVFAPWEPPKHYASRGRWRDSPEYATLVKEPWRQFKDAGLVPQLTRFAEVRALVGGVTAVQGAGVAPTVLEESLVRNVDRRVFGVHLGRSVVDHGRLDPAEDVPRLLRGVADGSIKAIYVHLAEGVDDTSRKELRELADLGLLGPATVLIHATALTREQLGEVRDAGARIVWSPQSNLRLYGATTDIASVLELGIPLGLGADWVPSGSLSTLAELRVARHALAAQGVPDDPRRLVGTVLWDGAAIAGLGDRIGDLRAGMAADVAVLERGHDDPWESVLRSDPSGVQLVLIGGNVVWGRRDWVAQLTPGAEVEELLAWGRPMALDTRFSVRPGTPPPRLAELRAELLRTYTRLGPIFA